MSEGGPIPGRSCGACTVCCVLLEVQEPSIAKPAGVPCRHLSARGCAIHPNWPKLCQTWFCGWRLIPGLPDAWRPDLSGILIYHVPASQPGYGPDGYMMCLSKGQEHLGDTGVLGFVQNMVERRVPLYLSLDLGKPERPATLANDVLAEAVRRRDARHFVQLLSDMIRNLSQAV